jgi:hypothetical protein
MIFAHVVRDVFTNFAIIRVCNIDSEHACVDIKYDIQGVHMGIPENNTNAQIMSTGTHMCCSGHHNEHTVNPHTVPKNDDVARHVMTVHIPRRMPRRRHVGCHVTCHRGHKSFWRDPYTATLRRGRMKTVYKWHCPLKMLLMWHRRGLHMAPLLSAETHVA